MRNWSSGMRQERHPRRHRFRRVGLPAATILMRLGGGERRILRVDQMKRLERGAKSRVDRRGQRVRGEDQPVEPAVRVGRRRGESSIVRPARPRWRPRGRRSASSRPRSSSRRRSSRTRSALATGVESAIATLSSRSASPPASPTPISAAVWFSSVKPSGASKAKPSFGWMKRVPRTTPLGRIVAKGEAVDRREIGVAAVGADARRAELPRLRDGLSDALRRRGMGRHHVWPVRRASRPTSKRAARSIARAL